ncbi:MAG: hypothetical protein WC549_04640 [Actinomycetota bacterium]
MKIIRTKKEIDKEIKRLLKNESNFVYNNYGSESSDNGDYEIFFDNFKTKETLKNLINWLTKNK